MSELIQEVVDSSRFVRLIRNSTSRYVFVDFYARWCGPCMAISPVVEKLAKEFPNIKYLKVDIDAGEELANTYAISSIPTFKIFRSGELIPIDQCSGANETKLRNLLIKYSDLPSR